MAREVKRKDLDEEFEMASGFDDKLFDEIMSEMEGSGPKEDEDAPVSQGGPAEAKKSIVVLESGGEENSSSSFSLDELDKFEDDDSTFTDIPDLSDLPDFSGEPREMPESLPIVASPPSAEKKAPEQQAPAARAKFNRQKLLLMASVPCLVLLLTGALIAWWASRPPEAIHVTKSIKLPVSVPYHEEVLEFFFLAQSKEGRNILSLGLEFEFLSLNIPDQFKKEPLLLKDVVYGFLTSRQMPKNTYSSWQKVIEKELPAYLQTTLPENRIRAVRLKHLDRV
jgi:flagellar basal body-associated protein FliL